MNLFFLDQFIVIRHLYLKRSEMLLIDLANVQYTKRMLEQNRQLSYNHK